jgi:hypothetical protein
MFTSNRNKKLAFVFVALVWVVANMVWMGCVSAPVTPSKKLAIYRDKSDFDFAKKSKNTTLPSRDEIEQKLGKPDSYLPDTKVAIYQMDVRQRREVILLLFLIPLDVYEVQKSQLALIEYDDSFKVKSIKFRVR